jgi:hypothetical protein
MPQAEKVSDAAPIPMSHFQSNSQIKNQTHSLTQSQSQGQRHSSEDPVVFFPPFSLTAVLL